MNSRAMDVLVIGAGPTGLMLAGELAAQGVTVTVAERAPAGSGLTQACLAAGP